MPSFHIGLGDNTVTRYEILASGDHAMFLMWELECSFSIHAAERDAERTDAILRRLTEPVGGLIANTRDEAPAVGEDRGF